MLATNQKQAAQVHGSSSSQDKINMERFTVVRNMIALKYGGTQPIGHSLIVEVR
jgi:hypothetical protein